MALSRKRDAWLLIGAASAGFILLALILGALIFMAKRKRAHSAISVPPSRSILKKKQDILQESGPDNVTFPASQIEAKVRLTSLCNNWCTYVRYYKYASRASRRIS